MKGITITTNTDNVNAADDRALNMGAISRGDVVFDTGNRFAYELLTNNSIRIFDGDGLMQGLHFRLENGSYEDLTITNGASGYNRIDSVVLKYNKNAQTGIEEVHLEVVKGTQVSGTPVPPDISTGSIAEGDINASMRLYNIYIEGISVMSVTPTFVVVTDAMSVVKKDRVAKHNIPIVSSADMNAINNSHVLFERSGNVVTARFYITCSVSQATNQNKTSIYLFTDGGALAKPPVGYRPISNGAGVEYALAPHENTGTVSNSLTRYNIHSESITLKTNSTGNYTRFATTSYITEDEFPEEA